MRSVKKKKVLVLGAGRSGLAAQSLVSKMGGLGYIYDDKKDKILSTDEMSKFQLVIVSPGVPSTHPMLDSARNLKIEIVSEISFAYQLIDTTTIAVTGTNGKTTTVHLIGELIKSAGLSVVVAGNNGIPLSSVVEEANAADFLVLEVSSYQLEPDDHLSCDVAVWLNLTEDHLGRHKDIEEYGSLKLKLFKNLKNGGVGIINGSDRLVCNNVEPLGLDGLKIFSLTPKSGAEGFIDGRNLVVGLSNQFVISKGELKLIGNHNYENILASLMAVKVIGIELERVREGLKNFETLKHRIQIVREIDGVRYYNDSKSTNVDSALKALESFDGSIVWIAGGRDKGASYLPLADQVKKKVSTMILIGEASSKIRDEIGFASGKVIVASNLKSAVESARVNSKKGDVVLFSPACSSFDMFSDYEVRGEAFIREVSLL